MNQAAEPMDPDEQQTRQLELQGVQNARTADQQAEQIRDNMMQFLSESELSEGTKDILRNYVSKAFILGYLKEKEVHELKWELRIDHELYKWMHPPQDSLMQGEIRQWVADDPDDDLESPTKKQEIQLATFFKGVWVNITRARGMKQQEIWKTQISRSEVERGEENGSDGLLAKVRR